MKKFCKKGHPARSGKRWLVLLMSLCLIGTMLPVTARAENSSPAPVNGKGLGVSIIADPTAPAATTDEWKGSYVYFGTYNGNPVKYRVLDRTTTDFGGTTMLLDCDSILWKNDLNSRFDDRSNVWADSEIKTYLNGTFLSGNFTDLERAAIAASSKASTSTTDGNGWLALNYAALSGEQIFLLDAKEATNTSYGYSNTQTQAANRNKTDRWWLRSAFSSEVYGAGCVYPNGSIQWNTVNQRGNVGVSPALNVNLSSVIFSSVLSGTSGQPGAEYKLTLHDENMTITPGTVTRDSGDEVIVPYTIGGTNGGNATRVSLMVLDKEYTAGNTNGAKLVAYEKLADAGSTSGTFTLTDDMKNGSYYYYIVAEDVNDGNVTDYASEPVQITIPASKYTVTVTNGTLSGGSTTGDYTQGETVTITAGAAPDGQQFKEWEVVSGSITLASSTSKTTTFTMPAEAVSVKANYEAIPVTEYTITASAGANGSITPSGAVKVAAGGSQTFTISPSSGYEIDTLKVDSSEVPVTTSYTFSNVNANHTIEVTFKQGSQTPNVPGVTAPSITTQPGNATVKEGETATFTIAASGDNLTYQWKINRNDGNGWVNIAGANAASYTTSTVDKSCNGFQYKCVVSNSAGNVESNTATLTVQDAGGSDNPDMPSNPDTTYQIIGGANSSWTAGSSEGLTIRGNGEFSKFTGVKVDGKLLDQSNYTAKEGSTIITLKDSYLNTLSAGTHTVEILWTDGSASTAFTINANTSYKKDDVPKTGDSTPIAWLFILAGLSGTGLILTGKKGRKNLETLRK